MRKLNAAVTVHGHTCIYIAYSMCVLCPCACDQLRVIVEAESVQEWSSKVVKIKAAFIHLKQLLANSRGGQ